MSGGTINIARDLWDDPDFPNEKFSEREAWIWLIAEAAWKPRQKRVASCVFDLQRGQVALSVRFAAQAWGWSKSRVQRFLQRLVERDKVVTQSGTGATIVTICNYDEYQFGQQASGTATGHGRDSSGTAAGQTINRESIGGGGSARAHTHEGPIRGEAGPADAPSYRERVLEAMGVGPDGIAGPSSWIGGQGDMAEARRWLELPGITEDVAIAEVRSVMASKRDTGPPGSFKYFTKAMQRLSGELTADQLKPMEAQDGHTNTSRAGSSTRHTRGRSAHDSFLRGFQSASSDFDG
ncbi:hypothetical protein BMI86_10195 [Thioclava sp. DLFJ5-1]|uniref:hypothetical protein n=1 Tax=Thioclava sp. DLFJ5-1 TaxID=1915314 RepID=UPI000998382A|nr:hypothetical protein [Thioclava sp. DLFJ5-1]OOY20867.1 hypothetical protein BMI86_10195 [Thioclava sp. DLFJ5-1]